MGMGFISTGISSRLPRGLRAAAAGGGRVGPSKTGPANKRFLSSSEHNA